MQILRYACKLKSGRYSNQLDTSQILLIEHPTSRSASAFTRAPLVAGGMGQGAKRHGRGRGRNRDRGESPLWRRRQCRCRCWGHVHASKTRRDHKNHEQQRRLKRYLSKPQNLSQSQTSLQFPKTIRRVNGGYSCQEGFVLIDLSKDLSIYHKKA